MADPKELIDIGLRHEKSGELEIALEHYRRAESEANDPLTISEAIRRQSVVYRRRCDWDLSIQLARRAGEVASAAHLPEQFAQTVNTEAAVLLIRGDTAAAARLFEQVVEGSTDSKVRAIALQNLGTIAAQNGEWDRARERFRDSVQAFQRADDAWGEAVALNNYGRSALDHGNLVMAEELLEQAVAAARRVEDYDSAHLAMLNQAEALAKMKQLPRAIELATAAHDFFTTAGNNLRRSEALRVLGDLDVKRGDRVSARQRYAESLALASAADARVEMELVVARLSQLDNDP
jgi:tetratricopeptide (TPR) repeat protein